MSKDTLYKLTQTAGVYNTTQITDELYTNVGASAIQMGTVKRLFLGGADVVIRTAAGGGGTLLAEGVDYTIGNEDFDYTTEIGFHTYTSITIITVAYQSGNLYFTYKTYGSYTDPDGMASRAELMTPPTVYKSTSYIITDTDGYHRIEATSTGGDVTITLPIRANNVGRRIGIANVATSTYKIIVAPSTANANQLSNDGLNAIWLPKNGDYIIFQESANSSCWQIVNEKITSYLRLNQHKGYGSLQTKIPQYNNLIESYGNLFTENHSNGYDSTTQGLSITINKSGKYAFSAYGGIGAGVAEYLALSINASSSETTIGCFSLSTSLKLSESYMNPGGGEIYTLNTHYTGYFKSGDIIRPHSNTASTPSTAQIINYFSVNYLG